MCILSTLVSALALLLCVVNGHYQFTTLEIPGEEPEEFKYIRRHEQLNYPLTDLEEPSLRCNTGGHKANGTLTASVPAGSNIHFLTDVQLYHQGPLSFFMQKVPNATLADGSGKSWFKIHDLGPKFPANSRSGADWKHIMNTKHSVTIPKCLPESEYLLRVQHAAVHAVAMGKGPQFHVGCAQVRVTGGGKDLPPPEKLVAIPEVFKADHSAFKTNIFMNFKEFEIPGGEVWTC